MAEDQLTTFIAPRRDCDDEFTVKRSRFIGSIRTVLSEEEAQEAIKRFPEIYPKSNHHCWGYRIGTGTPLEHCSDAGEPAGTAGRPILGTIKRHELTNTLIVVTRYFGGIKLGVRGLIDAYREAAELAVAAAGTVEMEFHNTLRLRCGYDYSKTLSTTLRKWGFTDEETKVEYGEDVSFRVEVPLSMRGEIDPPIAEMRERAFLTALEWDERPLVRERRQR